MVNLWSYDWPGNVRELENMIERLVIMCEDEVIDTDLLPPAIWPQRAPAEDRRFPTTLTEAGINLNAVVRELEGRMINEALKQTGGNKQAAAKLLGLKRTTFRRQAAPLRRDCAGLATG